MRPNQRVLWVIFHGISVVLRLSRPPQPGQLFDGDGKVQISVSQAVRDISQRPLVC